MLMIATRLLTLAILCFILTVLFTGFDVLIPKNPTLMLITVISSVTGLVLLASSVIAELLENEMGKEALRLELADHPELAETERRATEFPGGGISYGR